MPFTFKLNCHAGAVIEDQTLSNRKTGEELSQRSMIGWVVIGDQKVVIKRGAAKAAKEKEEAQS